MSLTLQTKLLKAGESLVCHARPVAASVGVAVGTALPAMTSYASDVTPDSGFLDSATVSVITDSVSKMAVTVTAVIGICVPVAFSVMGMTVGAKYAIRYVKSMLSKAAAS